MSLTLCPSCGKVVHMSVQLGTTQDVRDPNGQRHVCGDKGTPLGPTLEKSVPLAQRTYPGETPLKKHRPFGDFK